MNDIIEKKKETDPSLKPPKEWFDEKFDEIKKENSDYTDKQIKKLIGYIWYKQLDDKKRDEIRKRYGKTYGKNKSVKERKIETLVNRILSGENVLKILREIDEENEMDNLKNTDIEQDGIDDRPEHNIDIKRKRPKIFGGIKSRVNKRKDSNESDMKQTDKDERELGLISTNEMDLTYDKLLEMDREELIETATTKAGIDREEIEDLEDETIILKIINKLNIEIPTDEENKEDKQDMGDAENIEEESIENNLEEFEDEEDERIREIRMREIRRIVKENRLKGYSKSV